MRPVSRAILTTLAPFLLVSTTAATALATGVGGATWTPSESETTSSVSRFLIPGDAYTFRTDAGGPITTLFDFGNGSDGQPVLDGSGYEAISL